MTFFSHTRPWGFLSGSPARSSNFSPESKVITTALLRYCSGYSPLQHGGQAPRQKVSRRRTLCYLLLQLVARFPRTNHVIHIVSRQFHGLSSLLRFTHVQFPEYRNIPFASHRLSFTHPPDRSVDLPLGFITRSAPLPQSFEPIPQTLGEHHRSWHRNTKSGPSSPSRLPSHHQPLNCLHSPSFRQLHNNNST